MDKINGLEMLVVGVGSFLFIWGSVYLSVKLANYVNKQTSDRENMDYSAKKAEPFSDRFL